MDYYIDRGIKKRNTAGAKAPADISKICDTMGMERFGMPMFPAEKGKLYQKLWLMFVGTFYWLKLEKKIQRGDRIIYQHPMYGNRVALKFVPRIRKKKKCKFIVLIHDLESLRKGIEGVIKNNEKTNFIADNLLLEQFDYVICHNEYMKKYLIRQGFDATKIICLEIFDYLSDYVPEKNDKEKMSIAIAGNLAAGKSEYIYKLLNNSSAIRIHLYGINFDRTQCKSNAIYHGSFSPEELPKYLKGSFGLVWDGASAESCVGNTGEYLRYNNPHKTSLYLSSGIPVIVWKEAAIADFVLKNHCGIAVKSLYDIEKVLSDITFSEYDEMKKNAEKIGKKMKNGFFTKKAIGECK